MLSAFYLQLRGFGIKSVFSQIVFIDGKLDAQ